MELSMAKQMTSEQRERNREYHRRWTKQTKPWRSEERRAYMRLWHQKDQLKPGYAERSKERSRLWRLSHKGEWIAHNRKWQSKDFPHSRAIRLWHTAKRRALRLGLGFSLSQDFIERKVRMGVCEVTHIPFEFQLGSGRSPWGPSLDRIDPSKGYHQDNVRVTVTIFNLARNKFSDADLQRLSRAIIDKDGAS